MVVATMNHNLAGYLTAAGNVTTDGKCPRPLLTYSTEVTEMLTWQNAVEPTFIVLHTMFSPSAALSPINGISVQSPPEKSSNDQIESPLPHIPVLVDIHGSVCNTCLLPIAVTQGTGRISCYIDSYVIPKVGMTIGNYVYQNAAFCSANYTMLCLKTLTLREREGYVYQLTQYAVHYRIRTKS